MTTMATMFDLLPLDVIKYEILPFAEEDYFSRIGINSMLAPSERNSTPLRKNAATEFDMTFAMMNYKKLLSDIKNTSNLDTPSKRAEQLMAVFNCVINTPLLLKYQKKFRAVIVQKAEEHSNPNSPGYALISEYEKHQLVSNANKVLEALKNNPYVSEVHPSVRNDTWSPIDGAKPHIIVDNTALLEAAEKERRSKPHWLLVENKSKRRRPRRNSSDDEYYDQDGEWEYGYFDEDDDWVVLKVQEE